MALMTAPTASSRHPQRKHSSVPTILQKQPYVANNQPPLQAAANNTKI
jgi:hypothetical protein